MAEEGVKEVELGYTRFPYETETRAPARYRRKQKAAQSEDNEQRKGDKGGRDPQLAYVEEHERITISDDSDDDDDSDFDVDSIAESEDDQLT